MNRLRLVLLVIGWLVLLIGATRAPSVEASPPLAPASDYVTGCTGEYFNNMTLSGSPVMVRSDAAVNFYWPEYTSPGAGVYVSNYSVRWTCSVNVTTAGTYTFTMRADDGMNLLVDGNLLIWAWYDQGPSSYSNSIYLGAGWHTIRVEYYNNTLGGTAQVYSNINGVPTYVSAPSNTYLYPTAGGFLSNCTGEYFNNITLSGSSVLVRTDPVINFFWAEGASPGTGVTPSYYSVRWTCTVNAPTSRGYTFAILADDGMNVWVDGNFLIWAWRDQTATAYSNSIYLNAGAHTVRVEYYNRTMSGTAQASLR